jgi:hypothetical protein
LGLPHSEDRPLTDAPDERSAEACPRCGAHRLATTEAPNLVDFGYQPLNEVYMMSQVGTDPVAPGIECLACGAVWSDLEAFRAEQRGGVGHDPA